MGSGNKLQRQNKGPLELRREKVRGQGNCLAGEVGNKGTEKTMVFP